MATTVAAVKPPAREVPPGRTCRQLDAACRSPFRRPHSGLLARELLVSGGGLKPAILCYACSWIWAASLPASRSSPSERSRPLMQTLFPFELATWHGGRSTKRSLGYCLHVCGVWTGVSFQATVAPSLVGPLSA